MARRLKVFKARFGFHDSIVAAPSQAAALKAWGTHRNLFAEGHAAVAADCREVEAALARPGTPLLRPIGSDGDYAEDPEALPVVPAGPRPTSRRRSAAAAPRPPPDRSELDAAEAALKAVQARSQDQERRWRDRRADLEAEIRREKTEMRESLADAKSAVAKAREAWRRAADDA